MGLTSSDDVTADCNLPARAILARRRPAHYVQLVDVFLLWHVRHASFTDGRPTEHRDERGQLDWNEEEGDDLKLLGVYSTQEKAEDRIIRARTLAGFRDEPDCFLIDRYTLDEDQWRDGFVSTTAAAPDSVDDL